MDNELTQYLGKRFDKIDERFNKVDENIKEIKRDVGESKKEIGVNKINILFGFENAKKERARIEGRVNDTYNAVDGFIKIVTKLEDEFTLLKQDLNRVKLVIKEKLGVDLM